MNVSTASVLASTASAPCTPAVGEPADVRDFPRACVSVLNCHPGSTTCEAAFAICERSLRIEANGTPLVTLLCSEDSLCELAHGFLLSEGVIGSLADVASFSLDAPTLIASFQLNVPVQTPECPTVSSGFGGKILKPLANPPATPRPRAGLPTDGQRVIDGAFLAAADDVDIEPLLAAASAMRHAAREYCVTRGMHCSALFSAGELVCSFEDVGRHNTLDKIAGHCLLNSIDTHGCLLTTTGRISGEMCQKAVRMGVSGIASFSGPTDVAILRAREAGILLAGYVGNGSATVYATPSAPRH